MQNHKWGLSPEKWISTPELNDFFQILTVTPDLNEKVSACSVQRLSTSQRSAPALNKPIKVEPSYLFDYHLTQLGDFVLMLQLYVSTVEAREYPILGVQWHPEVTTFPPVSC